MTFGEKYTEKDYQAFLDNVIVEDNKVSAKYCSDLLAGKIKE